MAWNTGKGGGWDERKEGREYMPLEQEQGEGEGGMGS